MNPEPVYLTTFPPSPLPSPHLTNAIQVTGLVRFLTTPLYFNDLCIMLPSFTMPSFLRTVVEYQVADLTLVPPIVIRLVRDPVVNNYDLRCIQRISSGSAPTSDEIIRLLQKKFPWTGFKQGYGATESCACISAHPPDKYDYKYANSGGMLVASTVAKVVDENGKEVGVNETGEIWARGPQMAMGYLGNPEATAETFDADGFFHTGDIGSIDEEGFIHIQDRIKEMIKVKGQQVAPAEMEDLLLGHVEVEDCAVLGILDDYAGERPKAYVVPKPEVKVSEELGMRLMEYVREKKVRYKWIREVEFTKAIPRNPSGKILRRVLKERERSGKGPKGLVVKDERERARL
jgi:4-coumarate--CoA ligase